MVKVISINSCEFCNKLKHKLDEGGVAYLTIDASTPKGNEFFEKISKVTGNSDLPTVLVDKQIISPGHSFQTINQCYEIILKLNQE
jgi:glutaredoxin